MQTKFQNQNQSKFNLLLPIQKLFVKNDFKQTKINLWNAQEKHSNLAFCFNENSIYIYFKEPSENVIILGFQQVKTENLLLIIKR